MTSRKPLLPRNRDLGKEGAKAAKKDRYLFAILSKSALVEQVNKVMQQVTTYVSLTEDDLTTPTVSASACQTSGNHARIHVHFPVNVIYVHSGCNNKHSVLCLFRGSIWCVS